MAHVEVVRRSMQASEWIELRVKWLSQRIISKRAENKGWKIKEARQIGECRYEFYDSAWRPLNRGDMMFSPDGTSFLKIKTRIPSELKGEEVWLNLQTAAEMQVKCNGTWIGGLDPNRDRVLISRRAPAGVAINIEIEAYNRSKPDDERDLKTSGLRGCRQAFRGSSFVVIDHEIEAAMYDVQVLFDAMSSVYVREDIRAYIQEQLGLALNLVDYEEMDPDIYRSSIGRLRERLRETVFSSKAEKGFHGCGKVALVAHSHLDIAYYWRRIHSIQKNARTCLVQLRLMDKYPDFKYTHTQAFTYEMLEKHYPEIFSEVKRRVKEGRFEPVGAMYIEPDCNIPSAESLIRQCLFGQLYFRSRFNLTVNSCWLPDVFGNSWVLPQILKKCGVDYFVSNKMSTWNDTNRFPHNHFIWRGIDGTEIAACVPPTHFITWNSPNQIIKNWEAFQEQGTCNETLGMFGYGDGGSGVTEQMLEYMSRMEKVPGMPEVRHCGADEFLRSNLQDTSKLDVWDGELYLEMHRGTFTTKSTLKRMNRKMEILLRDAEILASLAWLDGAEYPHADLNDAWKLLLINQFHDILPGTHIAPVTRDAIADYEKIENLLGGIVQNSAGRLNIGDGGKEMTLLNTLTWRRKGPAFIPGSFSASAGFSGMKSQPGICNGQPGIWIDLENIEPLATVALSPSTPSLEKTNWFQFDGHRLETPFYSALIERDGSLSSVFDKENAIEIARQSGSLNRLAVYRDNPGVYDAWDIIENYKEREEPFEVTDCLQLTEAGPVCVEFSIGYQIGGSSWKQRIRFFRTDRRIEFDHDVDWHERNRLVKAVFDVSMLSRKAKCDIGAGIIERDTHQNTSWEKARFEVSHHKWADISESAYGVALINESKYGISFDGSSMGLSLLRGTVRPDPYADEERHHFMYALLPHSGAPEEAGIPEAAWEFNAPPRAFHGAGELSSRLTISNPNVHLQALKRPENAGDDGLIVRLAETHGKRGRAVIQAAWPIISAKLTNMLEDELPVQTGFSLVENRLEVDYMPFEILTFKLKFRKMQK